MHVSILSYKYEFYLNYYPHFIDKFGQCPRNALSANMWHIKRVRDDFSHATSSLMQTPVMHRDRETLIMLMLAWSSK